MAKTLSERVAELERELAELKAALKSETHIHYHYPPPAFQPSPYPPYRPWTTPPRIWTINAVSNKEI